MPKPCPILHLPSRADRIAFLRAIYAAGWNWVDYELTEALESHGVGVIEGVPANDDYQWYTHVWLTRCADINFISSEEAIDLFEDPPETGVTSVNSAAHFMSYGRACWDQCNPPEDQINLAAPPDEVPVAAISESTGTINTYLIRTISTDIPISYDDPF